MTAHIGLSCSWLRAIESHRNKLLQSELPSCSARSGATDDRHIVMPLHPISMARGETQCLSSGNGCLLVELAQPY
jgi:hypothetical protein